MPLIQRDVPWTRQPQIAAGLNPALVAADGLAAAFVARSDGAFVATIRGNYFAGSTSPVGLAAAPTPFGIGITPTASYSGSNGVIRLADSNRLDTVWESPSDQVTVIALVVPNGSSSSGESQIFGNASPNVSPFNTWTIACAADGISAVFVTGAGGVFRSISMGSLVARVPAVLIGTYDGATLRTFTNGAQVSSAAASGALAYANEPGQRGPAISGFWSGSFSRAFPGHVISGGLLTKAIPADRACALSKSPHLLWQLFAPRTQRFAVSSAATTPTLGTPTFVPGSLSASGFRPRFPVTWG